MGETESKNQGIGQAPEDAEDPLPCLCPQYLWEKLRSGVGGQDMKGASQMPGSIYRGSPRPTRLWCVGTCRGTSG